jgi:predicted ABC-type ATPase
MKRILIIAGPNGAGKTTFAMEFLPREAGIESFINADLIAAGLSPFNPDGLAVKAGRIMLELIDDKVRLGESFAFETTLSGKSYLSRISDWRAQGYRVDLFFLFLPNPEQAIERVARRVLNGGHFIPEPVIRRRYEAGLRNLKSAYKDAVDSWTVFDSSGSKPVIIETNGAQT